MNWLGGARNRMRGVSAENRKQKNFFERKRLASRALRASLPFNTPTTRKRKVSRDILNLQCVRETKRPAALSTGCREIPRDFNSRNNRFVNHVNLDATKKRNNKIPIGIVTSRKYKEKIHLPNASPCKIPSSLDFADGTDDESSQTRHETFKHLPTYQSTPLDRFRKNTPQQEEEQALFHPFVSYPSEFSSYQSNNRDQAYRQSDRGDASKQNNPVPTLQKHPFFPFKSIDNEATSSSRKKVNFSYVDEYYSDDENQHSSKDPHSEYDMSFITFENEDKKCPEIKHISPHVKQERISSPRHFHNAHSNQHEFSLDLNKSQHAEEQLFSPFRGQAGPFFPLATPAWSKCKGEYRGTRNTQKQKSPLLQPYIRKFSSSRIQQNPRWEPHTSHRMSFTTEKNADLMMNSPSNLFSFNRDNLTPDIPKIVELSPASARSEKSCKAFSSNLDTVGCISNSAYESDNQQKTYISDSYCQSSHSVKYDESDFIETKNSTPRSIWMKQDDDEQCSGCGSVDYTPFVKLRGKRKNLSDSLNRRGKNETACSVSQNDAHSFQEGNRFISRDYCCSESNIEGYAEAVRERENIGFQDEEIPPLDDVLREKEVSLFEKTQTVVTSTVISGKIEDELNIVHPSSYISFGKFTGNTKDIQDNAIHPASLRGLDKNDDDLNVGHLQTSSTPVENCSEKQIVPCYNTENLKLKHDSRAAYTQGHLQTPPKPPYVRNKREIMSCLSQTTNNIREKNIMVSSQVTKNPLKKIAMSERRYGDMPSSTADDHSTVMGFEALCKAENEPALKYPTDKSYEKWRLNEMGPDEVNSNTDIKYADKHVISPISQYAVAVARRILKNSDSTIGEKLNVLDSSYTIITASGIDENTHISPVSLIHPVEKYISVNSDNMEAKLHSELEINHAAIPTKDVALSPITWPVFLPAVTVDVASQTDIPPLLNKDTYVRILKSDAAKNALCGQFSSKSQTSESSESDKMSNDESNGMRRSLRKKNKRF